MMRYWFLSVAVAAVISGCSEREEILEGERLDLRADLNADASEVLGEQAPTVTGFAPPAVSRNTNWTHRNGSAQHRINHPALPGSLTRVWSANIGQGDKRRHRITADPVVGDGRIFTLDSQSTVSGFDTSGDRLWSVDLTPASDNQSDASGGGVAYASGRVFVTTGFGELVALDAESGGTLWSQKLGVSSTGAPTVYGDLVYAISRDSVAWAIDVETGRISWQLPATPSPSNMVGGSGPAVNERNAIFAFGSGELISVFRRGGVRVWNATASGKRQGRAYASVSDISGDPVLDGDVVYAANASGRLVALNAGSGERIWTAKEGAYSPVWPASGSVFLVSDENKLLRLDKTTGAPIWSVDLPYFTKTRERRREAIFAHYGPVLAGGRLIVPSSDGQVRFFNPQDGSALGSIEIPGGATSNPVIANETLYIVSGNGQLHAFR